MTETKSKSDSKADMAQKPKELTETQQEFLYRTQNFYDQAKTAQTWMETGDPESLRVLENLASELLLNVVPFKMIMDAGFVLDDGKSEDHAERLLDLYEATELSDLLQKPAPGQVSWTIERACWSRLRARLSAGKAHPKAHAALKLMGFCA